MDQVAGITQAGDFPQLVVIVRGAVVGRDGELQGSDQGGSGGGERVPDTGSFCREEAGAALQVANVTRSGIARVGDGRGRSADGCGHFTVLVRNGREAGGSVHRHDVERTRSRVAAIHTDVVRIAGREASNGDVGVSTASTLNRV